MSPGKVDPNKKVIDTIEQANVITALKHGETLSKKKEEDDYLPKPEEMRDAFEQWAADLTHIDDYAMWRINGAQCIIRVFKYEPPETMNTETKLIDASGESLVKKKMSKVLPIAKVLNPGSDSKYKKGQFVGIPQELAEVHYNPAYIDWRKAQNERPKKENSLKGEIPPTYVEGLYHWQDYRFKGDPFKLKNEKDDFYTFLVPDGLLVGTYTPPNGYKIKNVVSEQEKEVVEN